MTGQLISCLANCVLLLSLSLISILGSEILIGTLLTLPPFASLYLVFVCLCLFCLVFKSALLWSMSHTPTTYLIGSTDCRGLYAYFTFWLLSSGIMR